MTKWTDDFLSSCLDGLPRDKYRDRARAELNDHLLNLAQDLEDSGLSPEEAQARALTLMGDPGELNGSFRAEWVRRASHWKYSAAGLLRGVLCGYGVNALSRAMCIIPLSILNWQRSVPLSAAIFLCGTFPGLWLISRTLQTRFYIHPRCRGFILLGCLTHVLLDAFFCFLPSLLSHVSSPLLTMTFGALSLPVFYTHGFVLGLLGRNFSFFFPYLLLCILLALGSQPRSGGVRA